MARENTQERVLKLVKDGKSPGEIAAKIKTSRSNVYTHLRKLREAGKLEQEPSDNGHQEIEVEDVVERAVEAAVGDDDDAGKTNGRAAEILNRIRNDASNAAVELRTRQAELLSRVEDLKLEAERLQDEHSELNETASQLEAIAGWDAAASAEQ